MTEPVAIEDDDDWGEFIGPDDIEPLLRNNPTMKDLLRLINQQPMAISMIKNPPREVCEKAIDRCWRSIQYITNPSEDLCKRAIGISCWALEYIKYPSVEVCVMAFKKNRWSQDYIQNRPVGLTQALEDIKITVNV